MYTGHCARDGHLLHVVCMRRAFLAEVGILGFDLQDAELCNIVDNL